MDTYDHIRKSRAYSYVVTGFALYWMNELLQWVYSQDLATISAPASALIISIFAAIVGILKLTYTFATSGKPFVEKPEDIKE